ncbi:hypothetical protein [Mucilaginibacter sp.]|uniref:hypothetical protein n=1 Tax=Mucilaginibacter sp. TaxID=1882438 RepID=UPI0026128391|nr:hypothetical protein [Mucilaginibacter sp.]MDB5030578.1 hypothetical protein [Mucilaginibacter sp.]
MKNSLKIALLSAGIFAASQSYAQEHHEPVTKKIGHAAQDVGHKTSEVAVKGAVAVADKRYEGHWAPTGENVYIDKHSRYFYVDKGGHYKYLKKWQLRNKPYKH